MSRQQERGIGARILAKKTDILPRLLQVWAFPALVLAILAVFFAVKAL
jgi:hypothetical protein